MAAASQSRAVNYLPATTVSLRHRTSAHDADCTTSSVPPEIFVARDRMSQEGIQLNATTRGKAAGGEGLLVSAPRARALAFWDRLRDAGVSADGYLVSAARAAPGFVDAPPIAARPRREVPATFYI